MSFDLVPTGTAITDRDRCASFSNWRWRPLRFYCWMLLPRRVTSDWDTNDGALVSAGTARILADLIDSEITSGRAVEFVQAYNRTCDAAQGGAGIYALDIGALQRFSAFCRTSNGFTIE